MCVLMGMKGSVDGKTWTNLRTLRLLGTLWLLPLKITLQWNGLLTVSTTHVCLSITISRHSEWIFQVWIFSFYLWCSVKCLCNLTYTWHGVFPSRRQQLIVQVVADESDMEGVHQLARGYWTDFDSFFKKKSNEILEYSFLLRINQNTIRTPGMNHFIVIFYYFFPGLVTEKPIGPKIYIKKNRSYHLLDISYGKHRHLQKMNVQ